MALTGRGRRDLPVAAGGAVAASVSAGMLAGWLAGVTTFVAFAAAWWAMHRRGWLR